jgi:DNA-directed RNA polymerase specialized sigma24 family protein
VELELTSLAAEAVEGDPRAWRALWCRLEPLVWGLSGKWQVLGPLCRRQEDRQNVVLAVMERLQDDDFRRLRAFLSTAKSRADPVFRAWVLTVSTRVAIDYSRAHSEHLDPRGRRGRERWVELVPLAEATPSAGLDPARRAQVLELLERARSELRSDQLLALAAWLEGEDPAGIAKRLGVTDPSAAQRTLRSALKRLRDRYADQREAPAMEEPT